MTKIFSFQNDRFVPIKLFENMDDLDPAGPYLCPAMGMAFESFITLYFGDDDAYR